jgi:predicted nucleic acid-binding protein
MNKNHIFVDSNILIGAYVSKQQADIDCLKYLFSLKGKKLYTSSLNIIHLISFLKNREKNDSIKKNVQYLLTKFSVISVQEKDIVNALDLDMPDMEDNVQYVISGKFKCYFFVTNNVRDFSLFSNIKTINSMFVRSINKK